MSTVTPGVVLEKGPRFVWGSGKKAKPDDVARSLRALAMILKVGQSEARALEIVGEQFEKYDVGRAYKQAAQRMRREGATFKQAMLAEDVFPRTVHELIEAAQTSLGTQHNLVRAGRLIQQSQGVKKKLLISLIQPAFMLGMVIIFIFCAAAFIIPGFAGVFATIGAETPFLMTLVLNIAEVTKWVVGALIAVILLWVAFWATIGRKSLKLRRMMDGLSIRAPKIGTIVQLAATSRLFELLQSNLQSGMSEPEALLSAAGGCGNEALHHHCELHVEQMRSAGVPLSAFAATALMPTNARYMVASAPSVLQQIEIMGELAPEYRSEADNELEAFSRTIEPLMTYIVYGVAGALIVAVVAPMYSMFPALMQMG